MRQLVEASGLPKSTILHYVDQGLLPKPIKTSPNMAYYHPDCVELLAFIKSMQEQHRLPLIKIKKMLEIRRRGEDPELYLQLGQVIFGPPAERIMELNEFCRQSGLSPEQVDELMAVGLLLPLQDDGFDPLDAALGEIYARALGAGITPSDLSFYKRLGEALVDEEMALRARVTNHLSYEDDAALTTQMTKAARNMRSYVIERLFQLRVAASDDLKDDSLLSSD